MSTTKKRRREYEARRQQRWQERQQAAQQRRRRRTLLFAVLAVLALVAAIVVVVVVNQPEETGAEPTPPASQDTAGAGSTDAAELPTTDPELYESAPDSALAEARTWQAELSTSIGEIELELDGAAAPQAVANFVRLAQDGFYAGTACHRLLPGSLLQCGDPTATGTGGPGYSWGPIENAPEDEVYPAGTVAMARQGGDGESMGSQFFLVFEDVTLPDDAAGGYTVLGTVTSGLDLLAEVGAAGTVAGTEIPATPVIIEGVSVQ